MRNQSNILKMAIVVIGFIGLCSFMPAAWKTYSNKYITFKYPNTYKILNEKKSNGKLTLNCVYQGGNNISVINLGVIDYEGSSTDLYGADFLFFESGIVTKTLESMRENYQSCGFSCSTIKNTTKGKYSGSSFTLSSSIEGLTIQGECFSAVSKKRALVVTLMYDDASLLSQLNQIVDGMVVK